MNRRRPRPTTPKPHHMAFALEVACECGSEWGRPGVVSPPEDPDTEDLEIISMCARCAKRLTPEA